MDEVTTEQVQELMDMLTGKSLPENISMPLQPKLHPGEAFSVVYFLQEHMHIIPDKFELCAVCHGIFDTTSEGYIVGEYDEFHDGLEVKPQDVDEHSGTPLCSQECETKFWQTL
jgi:hypothetical protein